MSIARADSAFREGMRLHEHHDETGALLKYREAVELDGSNPKFLTTLGITVSRVKKNFPLAEQLCRKAIRKSHNNPQLYLNLAEVYENFGKKEQAMATLRDGLKFTKRDERLKEQIRIFGLRRPPIFGSLGRDHPLNVFLGKVRHAILPRPKVH